MAKKTVKTEETVEATPVAAEKYYIGLVFNGIYEPEAAIWCNKNNAYIEKTGDRQYEIKAVPDQTEEEKKMMRVAELKALLAGSDYWTSKYVDGEYTEEEWAEKLATRKAWREEVRELEK